MIRKRLIARRREKDKESLRYNRGDEDDWMKVEDEEEAIEDKEEDKYIKHCHQTMSPLPLDYPLVMREGRREGKRPSPLH